MHPLNRQHQHLPLSSLGYLKHISRPAIWKRINDQNLFVNIFTHIFEDLTHNGAIFFISVITETQIPFDFTLRSQNGQHYDATIDKLSRVIIHLFFFPAPSWIFV